MGLAVLCAAGVGWFINGRGDLSWMALLGFGLLGLIDDLFGGNSPKGLRGHLKALTEGRLTTGLLKLTGGLGLSICLAFHAVEGAAVWIAMPLVALCANAMNLLDLRPGRALSFYLPLGAFALWMPWNAYLWVTAVLLYPFDRAGRWMLGDTGSNLLGASLGAALLTTPTWSMAVALISLLALHIVAERKSISEIIDTNPTLRFLDRLTGRRD